MHYSWQSIQMQSRPPLRIYMPCSGKLPSTRLKALRQVSSLLAHEPGKRCRFQTIADIPSSRSFVLVLNHKTMEVITTTHHRSFQKLQNAITYLKNVENSSRSQTVATPRAKSQKIQRFLLFRTIAEKSSSINHKKQEMRENDSFCSFKRFYNIEKQLLQRNYALPFLKAPPRNP